MIWPYGQLRASPRSLSPARSGGHGRYGFCSRNRMPRSPWCSEHRYPSGTGGADSVSTPEALRLLWWSHCLPLRCVGNDVMAFEFGVHLIEKPLAQTFLLQLVANQPYCPRVSDAADEVQAAETHDTQAVVDLAFDRVIAEVILPLQHDNFEHHDGVKRSPAGFADIVSVVQGLFHGSPKELKINTTQQKLKRTSRLRQRGAAHRKKTVQSAHSSDSVWSQLSKQTLNTERHGYKGVHKYYFIGYDRGIT